MMKTPSSTYRLQFNKEFRFKDAEALLDYLARLGVSHLYASPVWRARPGSTHGYDVVDPTSLNPEIGTREEFDALIAGLQSRAMSIILDIVPNHMAVSLDNPWWYDILEKGQHSVFARYFDIDWTPASGMVDNKVILPILRTAYAEALEGRRLRLAFDRRGFFVDYYGLRLPLELDTVRLILKHRGGEVELSSAEDEKLRGVIAAIERWRERKPKRARTADPAGSNPGPALENQKLLRHQEGGDGICERLWTLYDSSVQVRRLVDSNVAVFNGRKGDPSSFNLLDELLNAQWYRLTFWRTALDNINYRRFFNISDLISLRAEELEVFHSTHKLVFELVRSGKVGGLRIDHIDGLRDPREYLRRVQQMATRLPGGEANRRFYIVVEKILMGNESLPREWQAAGTTGYDFLNQLTGVFVDASGLPKLEAAYADFSGARRPFHDVEYDKKKRVMARKFESELRSLQDQLDRLATRDRYGRDLSRRELERALTEVTACLPVYRTYSRSLAVNRADRAALEVAFEAVRKRNPGLSHAALRFVRRVLTLQPGSSVSAREKRRWLRFVMRWQQFTGPITAKGVEDTALYVYNSLLSLNEVGGNPGAGAVSLADFHRLNRQRRERWPETMNATSTHDTKRGEDARARLNVLSELAETFARRATQWSQWNARHRREVDGKRLPDANQEWMIYQTLLGAWPLDSGELSEFRKRLSAFIEKSMREAQVYSGWRRPNEANERAVKDFTQAILKESDENPFLPDFLAFQREVAFFGAVNSLAQLALKIGSPGVPDFYQGSELWNLSLVDPDNRRPVDYALRAGLLERIDADAGSGPARFESLLQEWPSGAIKLFITSRLLRFRGENQRLFAEGEYLAADVSGRRRDFLCGMARLLRGDWVVIAVPRLVTNLVVHGQFPLGPDVWEDTTLSLNGRAPVDWEDVLTGEKLVGRRAGASLLLDASALFARLPVAVVKATRTDGSEPERNRRYVG